MNIARIKELLEQKKFSLLKEELLKERSVDIAEILEELDPKATLLVFRLLPKETAVQVFAYLSPESQSKLSMHINEEELLYVLEELAFDDKIDFLEEMPANVVKRILQTTPEHERKLINIFLNYPDNSAGSIMTIELMDLKKEMLVREALAKIRREYHSKETIYTCYVTDASRHLEGIVTLQDLVVAEPDEKLENVMRREIISVVTSDDEEYVADLIKKYDLLAIPVTDNEQRLVGIITIDDIVDVMENVATEDFHKMATVGKIDINLLDASPFFMIKKRLPWLIVLIFMNIFSGAGLAHFENTIQSTITLIFFLPLLIASAGNAGAQSATLMIRALSVGDVEMGDWFRLLRKEIVTAILLGLLMGGVVAIIGLFRGGPDMAVIVSISMLLVVLVGSTIGMSLPFLLSRLKLDPATASTPLVTCIADISGVLIYFSIATWYLK